MIQRMISMATEQGWVSCVLLHKSGVITYNDDNTLYVKNPEENILNSSTTQKWEMFEEICLP